MKYTWKLREVQPDSSSRLSHPHPSPFLKGGEEKGVKQGDIFEEGSRVFLDLPGDALHVLPRCQ